MPRTRRIDYPGAWHHVMSRGARKEPTFRDPAHCSLFFEHLHRVVDRHKFEVHAYVLMPNHFHLLVRSVRGNLSQCMKHLLGPYTQILNRRHNWDGPVFRGRFKNQVVSESEHLRVLLPYIHLNPVRARLVNAPEFANWSSYTAYTGDGETPEWLTTSTVLAMYETVENLVAETRGFHVGELTWPEEFDLRAGVFRSWSPEIPRTASQKAAWKETQVTRVKHVYSIVTSLDWSEVERRERGTRGNPARRLAAWMLATYTDLTHAEIGRILSANRNQVSHTLRQMRKARFSEPLDRWVRRARGWLDKDVDFIGTGNEPQEG